MEQKKTSNLKRVGAMFSATSKKGTEYFSFKLFDSDIKFMAFAKTSKQGNKYYEITIDGEDIDKTLESLQDSISYFLSKDNGRGDNAINSAAIN
jgi:uncharacterized protein (DUF736 family)